MTNGSTPAGWYQDPTGQGDNRYWNGSSWTESVDRRGQTVNVAIDPAQAQQPPAPGAQVRRPVVPVSAPPMTTVVQQPSSSSAAGLIIGVVIVFFLALLLFAIVSNSDSSDDSPNGEQPEQVEDEAPAEDGG